MASIKRDYWNKNIPEYTKPPKKDWVKTRIEGHDYYGRSLKGKSFKKCKILVGKIIPLFALSFIFAPISIPLLFATGTYRKLGIWIREVHYNTEIKYIVKVASKNLSTSTSVVPFPIEDKNLIPKMVIDPSLANSKEAAQYIRLLSQVSKSFSPIVRQTTKALVNSGKLRIHDIPGIKSKQEAFNFIQSWKDLTCLNLSGFWDINDYDLNLFVGRPLKTLIIQGAALTNQSISTINNFTELERLHILNFYHVSDFPHLNNNLTEFIYTGSVGSDYPPKAWPPNLRKLVLGVTTHLLPSFDGLGELKELSLTLRGNLGIPDYSSLNSMTQLETLKIVSTHSVNCSFNGWTSLKNLSLKGSFDQIPPISQLTQLESLEINSPFIQDLGLGGNLSQMASLQRLKLNCNLPNFPNFCELTELKELTIAINYNTNLPNLDSLKLEKLTIYTKDVDQLPPNYLDSLINLKELKIVDAAPTLKVPKDFFNNLNNLTHLKLINIKGYDPLPSHINVITTK